jgi:sulfoxide reductase heme-binding subunit YedZ
MQIVQPINNIARRIPAWPLYIIGFIPAVFTFYLAATNQLGADPAKELEHELGEIALQLLVVTLLITPLRNWFNINFVKFRRAIGLLAFFYTALHLLTYLILDQQLWWDAIIKDITKRPYIIIGVVAFVVMIPLAITSNNRSLRRWGPIIWKRLHKLTYVAAIAGGLHYVMLKKTWQVEPLIYLAIIALLVGYRYWTPLKNCLGARRS